MAFELFPSLVATIFAAILFYFFLKRRSGEINGGQANNDAATNDGTARDASSAHTSAEGHGHASSSEYEVFLSFRGKDIGEGFADFLYTILIDMGIRTYRDDEELLDGEEIGPNRLQVINQSRISIPIFSKGYATSIDCLKGLVQMVECKKTRRQMIMPIFYNVAPSEIQHQTGSYREAFRSHKKKRLCDEETMNQWKAALNEVKLIKGEDLQSMPKRQEGQFAKKIAQKVFNELKSTYLVVSDYLVSVDHHVAEIMKMIDAQTNETQIIRIHGRGGIGKTTIAKIIYNKLLDDFEDCCYLPNINGLSKRYGMECLQNQLICDILKTEREYIRTINEGIMIIKDRLVYKKVLLLLDNVQETIHMNALVGNRDWFGKGSKIIITTRRKDVLNVSGVDCCYEVKVMNPDQSLKLFSKHAFGRDYPVNEYKNQSKKAIKIARGLPSALEDIGSLLFRMKYDLWDVTLKKLENDPKYSNLSS